MKRREMWAWAWAWGTWARVCCLLVFLAACSAAPLPTTSSYGLVGDWEGEMHLHLYCTNATRSCAFQVIFNHDNTFQMMLGPGCFAKNLACMAEGTVTKIEQDTVNVQYICPPNGRGCFCEDAGSMMILCWKYAKTTVMTMNLAMHLGPPLLLSSCPSQIEESCNPITQERVGLGILECADGECVVCDSMGTCHGRGRCDDAGECECVPGWKGPNCNHSFCPNACSNHGLCDITATKLLLGLSIFDGSQDSGVCRCVSGWSGKDCSARDIYTGRQALWQGLIFIGIVSTVATFSVLLKKFSRATHASRRHHHRTRRHRRRHHHIEVELDEFINPM